MKNKSRFIIIVNYFIYCAIIFLFILMLMTRFSLFNRINTFSIMSDSMSPSIQKGDLIFNYKAKVYKVGDIITYNEISFTNKTITHRIVAPVYNKNEINYITRGDGNSIDDVLLLNKKQIIGKVIFNIPLMGYVIYFAKTIPGLIIMIIIPATIIVYEEILKIRKESSKLKRKRAMW